MKKMRYLIPVDFSTEAENAARYGAALADASAASLLFLHVVSPPFDENTFLTFDAEAVTAEVLKKLEGWTARICGDANLDYECKVRVGEISTEIHYLADLVNADFIIMGPHGTTGINKLLYGSHTTDVMERVSCPVLAIPEDAVFSPYRQIVYATDYQSSDIQALSKLSQLAEVFGAAIDVVQDRKS